MCPLGPHTIKTWLSTQSVIVLIAAEAEIYALLKRAHQSLGVINLGKDFGLKLSTMLRIDASAALAITHRQRLGKLRHIDAHWLWIRDKVNNKQITATNVNGNLNPADLLTKHLPIEDLRRHVSTLGFEWMIGRAFQSLTISNVQSVDADHWTKAQQCVMRIHKRPRRSLFTPFQSRGGSQDC